MHLLHPALVHFSIAFLVVGGLCEAWGLVRRGDRAARFGSALVLLGTGALLLTVVTGFLAQNSIEVPAAAAGLVERHERIGLAVLATFLAALLWKGWVGGAIPDTQRVPYAAWLVAAVLLVVWGALLGGEMVYAYGVGVTPRFP